jgi:hypothetical protein
MANAGNSSEDWIARTRLPEHNLPIRECKLIAAVRGATSDPQATEAITKHGGEYLRSLLEKVQQEAPCRR